MSRYRGNRAKRRRPHRSPSYYHFEHRMLVKTYAALMSMAAVVEYAGSGSDMYRAELRRYINLFCELRHQGNLWSQINPVERRRIAAEWKSVGGNHG